MRQTAGFTTRPVWLLLLTLLFTVSLLGSASAQEENPAGDSLVDEGRVVYQANCQGCHQSDGSGLPGVFPPLLDNPNLDDADYVRSVIADGLSGEIEVLGETYNGSMPGFPALDEAQVSALVVYLQDGLGAPAPTPPSTTETGDTAGTSLPSGAVITYWVGLLIALVAIGIVVAPIVLSPAKGERFTRLQAWLKSGAIVVYFIVATVFLPSQVVEWSSLASPPSMFDSLSADTWDIIRSLIGSGVWLVAFALGVWGLRVLQRRRVI